MRSMYTVLLSLAFALPINAQIDNKCLLFNGANNIQFKPIASLETSAQTSYQLWFNIEKWIENSLLLVNETNSDTRFSVELGAKKSSEIQISFGNKKYTFSHLPITENKWVQLTGVAQHTEHTSCTLYIDGVKYTASAAKKLKQPKNAPGLHIGTNFKGRIDEIRIWNTAIELPDFSMHNTLNGYHPKYNNLVAYWKADQLTNTQLTDEKQAQTSVTNNVKLVKVTDNTRFNYKLVSGYTGIGSLFTRSIPKEAYLLTNDLIILAGNTTTDGHVSFGPSDDNGTAINTVHLPHFEGRNGVLAFNGADAVFQFPSSVLMGTDAFCFEGWFYCSQPTEGAYLLRQSIQNKDYFSIKLANENTITLTINNEQIKTNVKLKNKEWQFVSVSGKWNAQTQKTDLTVSLLDTNKQSATSNYSAKSKLANNASDSIQSKLGVNFTGKMDDVSIWNMERTTLFINDAEGIQEAALGKSAPIENLHNCLAYWKFDLAQQPGHDSFSWTSLVQLIRSAFDVHTGYKIRASFSGGSEKNWEEMITSDQSRKRFAKGVAELLDGPLLDGVDLDFEWCYDAACWDLYAKTIHEVKAAIPAGKLFTITPHVVAYKLPQSAITDIDFALFQNYGPSPDRFTFEDYSKSLETFRKQGYPDHKIVLSTSTTTSKGIAESGATKLPTAYKNLVLANSVTSKDAVSGLMDGYRYWINSVDQTRKRAKLVVDQNLGGIMFWDMGCDIAPDNDLSIIRAISTEISSNLGLKKLD